MIERDGRSVNSSGFLASINFFVDFFAPLYRLFPPSDRSQTDGTQQWLPGQVLVVFKHSTYVYICEYWKTNNTDALIGE